MWKHPPPIEVNPGMKIAIIGYSGAGKSTLAGKLGSYYRCDVLHLDAVHFAPNWVERSEEEMTADVKAFMERESWVIEGNYSGVLYQRRMEEADQIIFLNFNRFSCLWRAYRRYRTYQGKVRPDMAAGCDEKLDWEFVCWILRDGRSPKAKRRYRNVMETYPQKVVVLKNQRELDRFWERTNQEQ